jgi:hypothetical protein
VASYHTGQQEAFAFASGAAYDSDWEKSVSAFFTQDAAFTVARSDSLGRNTHDEEVTLYSLMDQFRTLIQRGLRDSVGEGNSFTAIYVERCREREFHLLHNNTFYPGAPVRTQLKDYSALVKRAGRRFRQLDDSTR